MVFMCLLQITFLVFTEVLIVPAKSKVAPAVFVPGVPGVPGDLIHTVKYND